MSILDHENYLISNFGSIFMEKAMSFLMGHLESIYGVEWPTNDRLKISSIKPHWGGSELRTISQYGFAMNADVYTTYIWHNSYGSEISMTKKVDLFFEGITSLDGCQPPKITKVAMAEHRTPFPSKYNLDGRLLPLTCDKNFEKWATKIITKYTNASYITAEDLAAAMGLVINDDYYLTDDTKNMARIVLRDTNCLVKKNLDEAPVYIMFKAGTILLDHRCAPHEKCNRMRNSKIYHECIHWEFHRPAMYLMDKAVKIDSYACDEAPANKTMAATISLMEYQAKAITSCLQFPKDKIEHDILACLLEGKSYSEMMEPLREKYKTTMLSLKIRLKELGYPVDGYYSWTNGDYAPDLDIPSGELAIGEFYQISYKKAYEVYQNDSAFKRLISSGLYCYVDDVFVLGNKKYINHDKDGNSHLSEYAKTHLRECCIKFVAKTKQGKELVYYQEACDFLNSTSKQEDVKIKVSKEDKDRLKAEQETKLKNYRELEQLKDLVQSAKDFSHALSALCKYRELTRKEVSKNTGKGEDTIKKIVDGKGQKDVSIDSLTRVCVVLKLPPLISRMLFAKCSCLHYPEEKNPKESVYLYILDSLWDSDINVIDYVIGNSSDDYVPSKL